MKGSQLAVAGGIVALLGVSCGTGGGGDAEASGQTASFAPLSQRLNQEQGYQQDAEGNWIARSDRRSQFDGMSAAGVERSNPATGRGYHAGAFEPAEWTRATSARPQSYTGPTDGSAFRTTAAAQGKTARQSGTRSDIGGVHPTGGYRTGTADETSAPRINRTSDALTENRRDDIPPPEIIDWKSQRKLSLDQSRSMLSR